MSRLQVDQGAGYLSVRWISRREKARQAVNTVGGRYRNFSKALKVRQLTERQARAMGYIPARILPDGRCAGIMKMIYTYGLFVGLDEYGTSTRFCYDTREEAELALAKWDGAGDPPGNWIKQKPEDRMNPNYKEP